MLSSSLEQVVGECAGRYGTQVVEIIVRGRQPRTMLEVFVDSEAGVTTELCADISRAIAAALRERPLMEPLLQLTVSSPGIDRPLRFPWQYRKHVGRTLAVRLTAGDATEEITGRLTAVDDGGITLDPGRKGAERRIAFTAIARAVVRTPW